MKKQQKLISLIIYVLVSGFGYQVQGGIGFTSATAETRNPLTENRNKPNILWICVEDINPLLGCYGTKANSTPNIDRLAQEGVLFEKAFAASPVCSPARSAIITGYMATTLGIHNHHCSRTVEDAIFLPQQIKTIPELFKQAGYYTFCNGKEDYNFLYDRKTLYDDERDIDYWYTFSGKGHWRDAARKGRPFFGQFQLTGWKVALNPDFRKPYPMLNWTDPDAVEVPPYYPNVPLIKNEWIANHDANRVADYEVGQILDQLKADGLLDNTIIILFSDHGYEGLRHKQFLYEGGIRIPLIVAAFGKAKQWVKGSRRNDLVSAIDIGPTSLSLAGLKVPTHMEGKNMLAKNYHRDYVISTRDRCDFTIDRMRSVRTENIKYIRNYMPDRSYMQPNYRDRRAGFKLIKEMFETGQLNEVQARYWLPNKPVEELYDLRNDPDEINNLAENPAYAAELLRHRSLLETWVKTTNDQGQYPEKEESLRFIYNRYGDRCTSPEFDYVKTHPIANMPKVQIK